MIVSILMLLCVFLISYFTSFQEPVKLVLFILEAVILLLIVLPWIGFKGVP